MLTKRLSSSAAKQGRTPVSALAITVAAALGTLAMPAFSADAKPAAKEDTITVVGGSNTAQQESAWGRSAPMSPNAAPPAPKPIRRSRRTRSPFPW